MRNQTPIQAREKNICTHRRERTACIRWRGTSQRSKLWQMGERGWQYNKKAATTCAWHMHTKIDGKHTCAVSGFSFDLLCLPREAKWINTLVPRILALCFLLKKKIILRVHLQWIQSIYKHQPFLNWNLSKFYTILTFFTFGYYHNKISKCVTIELL